MATRAAATAPGSTKSFPYHWLLLGLLGGVLVFLFAKSLESHQILFANDRPLGALSAEFSRLPDRLTGTWGDTSWLGGV